MHAIIAMSHGRQVRELRSLTVAAFAVYILFGIRPIVCKHPIERFQRECAWLIASRKSECLEHCESSLERSNA